MELRNHSKEGHRAGVGNVCQPSIGEHELLATPLKANPASLPKPVAQDGRGLNIVEFFWIMDAIPMFKDVDGNSSH